MFAGFSSVVRIAESWNPGLEYMGHEVLEAFESRIGHHPFAPWPIFCMLPGNRMGHSLAFFAHAKSPSYHIATSNLAASRHIRILTRGQVLKSIRIFQSLEELIAAHPLNRPKAGRVSCLDNLETRSRRYSFVYQAHPCHVE